MRHTYSDPMVVLGINHQDCITLILQSSHRANQHAPQNYIELSKSDIEHILSLKEERLKAEPCFNAERWTACVVKDEVLIYLPEPAVSKLLNAPIEIKLSAETVFEILDFLSVSNGYIFFSSESPGNIVSL